MCGHDEKSKGSKGGCLVSVKPDDPLDKEEDKMWGGLLVLIRWCTRSTGPSSRFFLSNQTCVEPATYLLYSSQSHGAGLVNQALPLSCSISDNRYQGVP